MLAVIEPTMAAEFHKLCLGRKWGQCRPEGSFPVCRTGRQPGTGCGGPELPRTPPGDSGHVGASGGGSLGVKTVLSPFFLVLGTQ